MEIESLIWVVIGLMAMMLLVVAWLGTRIQKLEKSRTHHVHDSPLTKEQRTQLHQEASRQYEASMVRELKRFETEMSKLSDDLLGKLQAQIGNPEAQLQSTIEGLVQATTTGYSQALDTAVQQLKARLVSIDALIASHADAADKAVQAMVDERKAAAIHRVDESLGELFADYMTTVASGLDLSAQQDLIMQRLESIKPQLLEDVKRA